ECALPVANSVDHYRTFGRVVLDQMQFRTACNFLFVASLFPVLVFGNYLAAAFVGSNLTANHIVMALPDVLGLIFAVLLALGALLLGNSLEKRFFSQNLRGGLVALLLFHVILRAAGLLTLLPLLRMKFGAPFKARMLALVHTHY